MSSTLQPSSGGLDVPRVLLLPSAGMGHLIPFVRLAAALTARRIDVTVLAACSTVSAAESRLLSSLPSDLLLDFPIAPLDASLFPPSSDPFFLRMEGLRRSAHLLQPFLSASFSSPISALIVDISAASSFIPAAAAANIPCFVLFTSSAAMLALCSASPFLSLSSSEIDIAGVLKIPNYCLPPPLHDPNHLFTTQFVENGRALGLASGILVNTFPSLEPEVLFALNSGKVVAGLPPVFAVGPLPPARKMPTSLSPAIQWLDKQQERSVMYVSFGSRTMMSSAQMRELGAGLEMSGCKFLWVVKSTKVDRDEKGDIDEFVGKGYVRRVEGRGLVVKEWVEQEVVLSHRAVAGFLSHCGWNSVTEAAAAGVRVLAWPRMGDQRVNAEVVARNGLGLWPSEWVWEAEEGLVVGEEISKKVREVIEDKRLVETVVTVAAEAAAAIADDGSAQKSFALFEDKIMM
ncbi:UDP-glycosyltransferase 72E1 [Platanthera zijinensis]|uniref:Glycosyltransferase n=1 Tax=Platanthera zijinensis TaxID=2320716 RepID=A0AAP0BCY2_9ASPA